MKSQRKPQTKKIEHIQSEVKQIESLSKKNLKKVEEKWSKCNDEARAGCAKVKLELERLGKTEDSDEWKTKAMKVNDDMKEILQRQYDLQHDLLETTNKVALEIEKKSTPLKKELPTVLDFSESDRVQLAGTVDKALDNVQRKHAEIQAAELKLKKQLEQLNDISPDPSWPKDETVKKLQMVYQVVARVDDPEVVRSEMLLTLAGRVPQLPMISRQPKSNN